MKLCLYSSQCLKQVEISYLKVQDLFPPDGLQLFNTLVKVSVTTLPRSFVNWILSIFPRPFRANSLIIKEAHAEQGLEHLPSTEFSTVITPRKGLLLLPITMASA
jgi:hypothetical protein